MNNSKIAMLLFASVVAVAVFPSDRMQAREGFFAKRRAARQQSTNTYSQQNDCPYGQCDMPGTGGSLRTNKDGGFEGQLTDHQYSTYLAQQGIGPPLAQQQMVVQIEQPIAPVERSIVVAAVQPAEPTTVQAAIAALESAKRSMAAAEALLQAAVKAEKHANALAMIDLDAKIKRIELDHNTAIEDLKREQESLAKSNR